MIRESLLRLTKDSLVYGAGQAIGRGLQVLLVPILTRAFSPAEYGVVDLLAVVSSVATFVIVMGMDGALARYFPYDDPVAGRSLVTSSATWRLAWSLGIGSVVLVLADPISRFLLGDPAYVKYVRIVAVTLPIASFVFFQYDVLRVTFQPVAFISLNLLNTLLLTGFTLLFVLAWKREVSGALWARAAADGLTATLGFVFIRKSLGGGIDRTVLRRMILYGLPFVPASVIYWLVASFDRWLLARFVDLTSVGVYAVAVKLGFVVTLFVTAFQLAWGPMAYAKENDPSARRLYARVLLLFTGVASWIALAIGLFAPEVVAVLVPRAYAGGAVPGAILAFAAVANGAYQITALGVLLAFRPAILVWTALVAAIVTVVLGFALVGPFGTWGVALATLAGFTTSTVAAYVQSQRLYPIPYRGLRSLLLFVGGFAAWVLGMALNAALSGSAASSTPGGITARAALLAAFTVVVILACRRVPPSEPAAA